MVDATWFAYIYPVVVNIVTLFVGIFLVLKFLKPQIVISDTFVTLEDSKSLFYKFYNNSWLLAIIDINTTVQLVYTNKRYSRIFTRKINEEQGNITRIPGKSSKSIKENGIKFYLSNDSGWTRGISTNTIANKIAEVYESVLVESDIKLLIKFTYKSELTGIQYSKYKFYDIKEYLPIDDLGNNAIVETALKDRFAKSGYFKLGQTFEVVSKKQRQYQYEVQKVFREGGKEDAGIFVRSYVYPD